MTSITINDHSLTPDTTRSKKKKPTGPTVRDGASNFLILTTACITQFSLMSSSTVQSNLPQKRKKTASLPSQTLTSSSQAPSTVTSPHTSSVPPVTPPRPANSSKKSRFGDQTPISKTVSKRGCTLMRVYLATKNAFPDDPELEAQLKACFKASKNHLVDAGILNPQEKDALKLSDKTRQIVSLYILLCSRTLMLCR